MLYSYYLSFFENICYNKIYFITESRWKWREAPYFCGFVSNLVSRDEYSMVSKIKAMRNESEEVSRIDNITKMRGTR